MARPQRGFTFRVTEREVVDPERVAQALRVWADCLARRLPPAVCTGQAVSDAADSK